MSEAQTNQQQEQPAPPAPKPPPMTPEEAAQRQAIYEQSRREWARKLGRAAK